MKTKNKTTNLLRWALLSCLSLISVNVLAQTTTFSYTATEKIPRFEEIQYFKGAKSVISHEYNEDTGEGIVVYEDTVTELGSYCLQWTSSLTGIVIPEGVTRIGFQAFWQCSNLTNVTLPKSLKEIGVPSGQAFGGCTGLANGQFIIDDLEWWCSLTINGGSNPLSFAKKFYSAPDVEVTDLVIPEGVESICYNAFTGCEGIQSVTLPSTLTSIGGNAFSRTNIKSVDIPANVTEIGEYAFSRCAKLTSVTIPEGVTTIGLSAFIYSGLTSLTLPSTITSMSQSFYGCDSLATLTLTDGITSLGASFYDCTALTEVNIPGSVKEINSSDFSRCLGLTTVILNEGTENVNFSSCDQLANINFPSTVKKISFSHCPSLKTVTLPEGVTRISSFEGCTGLKQINIPSTVTYIGGFKACDSLETVIIADIASWCAAHHYDATYYGPTLLAGKLYLGTVDSYEEITDLVIPEGVTTIAGGTFFGLPDITSVTLPSTLTTWEYKAFYGCTGVTDVYCLANPITLNWSESDNNFAAEKATRMHVMDKDIWTAKYPAANATFVGDMTQLRYTATAAVSAFDNTDNFTGATRMVLHVYDAETGEGSAFYCGEVTALAEGAFANNKDLTSISLPDGMTTIGAGAFNGCDNLKTLTLPSSITLFSEGSFDGLTNITDVYCAIDPASLTWDGTGFMAEKATQFHIAIASDWQEIFPDANVTFVGDMTRLRYTATAKEAKSFYTLDNFIGATAMVSHDFNPETGEGSVIFKGEVTGLKYRTFYQNELLTSITIPATVTKMEGYIFYGNPNLVTVSLPNTITSIGEATFASCSSLTTVNIPTSLAEVPRLMFNKCSSLKDIDIPDSVTKIGSSAFALCTGLTSIFIPATVTEIMSRAFENCTNLEKVITPDLAAWCAIKYSGNNPESCPLVYAHHLYVGDKENNTEVTDLVIPDGVEEISKLAFWGFSAMTSLSLPTSVKKIGDYAFRDCTGLTEVTLPEGFEDFGRSAFDGSTSLTQMVLPATLRRIDYYAFTGLKQLADIYCYADPDKLDWQNSKNPDALMPEKQTRFHVKSAAAWETKFPDANVTFVGDLPHNITVEDITNLIDRYLNGDAGITVEDITSLIDEFLTQ